MLGKPLKFNGGNRHHPDKNPKLTKLRRLLQIDAAALEENVAAGRRHVPSLPRFSWDRPQMAAEIPTPARKKRRGYRSKWDRT